MMYITPDNRIREQQTASPYFMQKHLQYLAPGVEAVYSRWRSGYMLTQTICEGTITVTRYVIEMQQTEVFYSHVQQATLMFSWLQQGNIDECYISHYGKTNFSEAHITLLYFPAHNTQICTLTPGCYAFTLIAFSASDLLPYEKDPRYIAQFLTLYRQYSTMPVIGKSLFVNTSVQTHAALICKNEETGSNLDTLIHGYGIFCKNAPRIHSKNISRMHDIINYINKHPHNKCSLHAIAAHIKMSASQVKNIVKSITNQNVSDFIGEQYMQQAWTLLYNNREMRVTEVADAIGYTPTYLSRRFKQRFNVSPVDFQNNTHAGAGLFTG